MSLQVYNSYTRQREPFESLIPGHVGMYVCGPTVSGESHLGHARPYITFDVVYRYLTHLGYKVRYVRNITDAGHFEEEGRVAEDKISTKAVLEKLEPMELVQKYTNLFHWAMNQFNNIPPSIEPTATGHIVEQIEMIKQIIAAGYAYEVDGSVYFDVKKYAANYAYGKLSGRVIDDLLETTRLLEGQDEKHNKQDFALWKAAPPKHIMRWPSPWGEGFPGWHIECSAMSSKYLGKQFDIHGGGMDLLFPHHESEIAQSNICNGGEVCARYWLHNNMITIDGKKMGKSYGNQIMLTEMFSGKNPILAKPYSPMTIRFFILQTQYHSTLDFSNAALIAAEKGLKRLWEAYQWLMAEHGGQLAKDKMEIGSLQLAEEQLAGGRWNVAEKLATPQNRGDNDGQITASASDSSDVTPDDKVRRLVASFEEGMNDDFNTAKVLASMFELVPVLNGIKDKHIASDALRADTWQLLGSQMKLYVEDILGLKDEAETGNEKLTGMMQLLINLRKEAKAKKDYATSDAIRKNLQELGISLKDEKDGNMSYSFD